MGDFLNADQLSVLRTVVTSILPDTCYILRNSGTVTAAGNKIYTWGTVGTASCRLDPMARQESTLAGMIANREASKAWYTMTFEYDTDIQLSDRIEYNSVTYELIQLDDDHTYLTAKKATIVDIQGDQ